MICRFAKIGVELNAVCKDFASDYGLVIPYHPMLAILTRTTKAGYIEKRRNGVFVPVEDNVISGDFTESALEQERKYQSVLEQFREYCQSKHGETLTKDEAESVFIAFLKDHDLDILFINQDLNTILPDSSATISQRYLINSFVEHVNKSKPEIFAFVVDISVGHILANTFLSIDFDKFQGNLSKCNFYLDIGFLFNLVGTNGDEKKTAYSDFVKLLKEQRASLFLFQHTYDEFMGIIEGCLLWVESASYDSTKASA